MHIISPRAYDIVWQTDKQTTTNIVMLFHEIISTGTYIKGIYCR